ncbi:MAG: pseudouridine synthase [Longicatena sp.]
MRLDKYLAHASIGSRKQVKQLIRKKHIKVNGIVCTSDDQHIDENSDVVYFDDVNISYQTIVYLMLNKPKGVVSATKDELHATVFECIDTILPNDCFPVGRLDIDTEGLLLISNDGKFAHDLLAPKKHVDKTYYVETMHALSNEDIKILESGTIILDDEVVLPAHVNLISECAIELSIHEGKYHQVKRMLHALHNEVTYLKRIRFGSLLLDESLGSGEWRALTTNEIKKLKKEG